MTLRRSLDELHSSEVDFDKAIDTAWPLLSHTDRFIRYSARVAVEHQPAAQWLNRALQTEDPQTVLELSVAVAKQFAGDRDVERKWIEKLERLDWDGFDESQKLQLLRSYSLILIRTAPASKATAQTVRERFANHYPSSSKLLNRELSRLLIAVEEPTVAAKTMELLTKARTQEEQIHYVFSLRSLNSGWTSELRRNYFQWFLDAASFKGGNSFSRFLQNIRNEAIEKLPPGDRAALATVLAQPIQPKDPYENLKARPLVKKWTLDDLTPVEESELVNRNLENGKEMFAVGQCYKCHRISGEGGIVGPDLTAAGRRFSARDMIETLVDPSKEVSDQYRATKFQLETGETIIGRVANLNGDDYMVQTDLLDPGKLARVNSRQIEGMKDSEVSMMPTGLLDSMTREDILDLLAYMKDQGKLEDER